MKTIKRRKPFQYRRFFGGQVEDRILIKKTGNVAWRWMHPISVFGHPYLMPGQAKAFMVLRRLGYGSKAAHDKALGVGE